MFNVNLFTQGINSFRLSLNEQNTNEQMIIFRISFIFSLFLSIITNFSTKKNLFQVYPLEETFLIF